MKDSILFDYLEIVKWRWNRVPYNFDLNFCIENSQSSFRGWKILLSECSSSKLFQQCYQLFLWLFTPRVSMSYPIVRKISSKLLEAEPTNQNCFCCCRIAFYEDSLCSFLKNFSHQISFFDCTGYIQDYSSQCCNYVRLPIMAIWYRIGLPMPATICPGNAMEKLGSIKIKDWSFL